MTEMSHYDSIVVGAGHNGLVCAALLARRGHRVLVIEAANSPGGLAADREFHPGFHASVAHSISHFSSEVAGDLNLATFGFSESRGQLATVGLSATRQHVVIRGGEISGVDSEDVRAFREYRQLMQKFAAALQPFWSRTMPPLGSTGLSGLTTFVRMGLNLRRLGKKDMREFLRIASLPARDLMDEYFSSEILKAVLSWDGLIGARLAPRSPNSAVLAMLYRLAGTSQGTHSIPAGGVDGLMRALSGAAEAAGVTVRYGTKVDRISIDGSKDGLKASGVRLENGECVQADRVISAADPKRTFLGLVGVENLDIGFTNRIRRLRCDGFVGKLHLALSGLPNFDGMKRPEGRLIIAPDMDSIEFAFDDAKYGRCSSNPVMEIVVPSLHDTSLAPPGQHVLSAHVMYVPYSLKGGWTDAARDEICRRAVATIARYAPDLPGKIIHQEFLTPLDLERAYRVTGGHWHHTEFAIDQLLMMRPTYGAAQYATPIPGLYLCGAGCHPGGDVVGAAGYNAAREILR